MVLAKLDDKTPNGLMATTCGDSGYILFRPEENGLKELYKTPFEQQQWMFNGPNQLSSSTNMYLQKALHELHEIEENDIIVMASDGLFDNVYSTGIIKCLEKYMKEKKVQNVAAASDCMAHTAEINGVKENW